MNYLGNYSIKELEKLSGVKAHTIRIWEQRYSLLSPNRTSTNIRFYDDEQLKRLLNVALLLKNGYKISLISEMSEAEMQQQLLLLYNTNQSVTQDDKINGLIIAMIELNELMFEKVFSSSVTTIGFEDTIIKVIYPFLERVGIMWTTGDINPAQEHFISNLIRQKLIVAIDGQSQNLSTSGTSYLLFLPEDELHEIGLLMASYMLRKKGHRVFYLGQNVPLHDAVKVHDVCNPNYLLLFFTTPNTPEFIQGYLMLLRKSFPKIPILISGNPELISKLQLTKGISWIKSIEEFQQMI